MNALVDLSMVNETLISETHRVLYKELVRQEHGEYIYIKSSQ